MIPENKRQQLLILLKETLITWFERDELEDLSFDLGLDFNALGSTTKGGNVRNLIMLLSRRGRIEQLIEQCEFRRPEIDWDLFAGLSAHIEPAAPLAQSPAQPTPQPRKWGLALGLATVLLTVLVSGVFATSYYFDRTAQFAPTPAPRIIHIPATETPIANSVVVVQPTAPVPINTPVPIINTSKPGEEVESAETGQEGAVEESTGSPRSDSAESEQVFRMQITDTYLDKPLQVVNIRGGPGVEFPIVTQLAAKSNIEVVASAPNSTGLTWYLIQIDSDEQGWISSILVETGSIAAEDVPLAKNVPQIPIDETPDEQDNAAVDEFTQTN